MKIAFIQCPLWGTFDPPVALAQLSACLKQDGHKVSSFDLNIKLYLQRTQEYRNVWAWEQSDFWYKPEMVKEYCGKNEVLIGKYVDEIASLEPTLVGFSVNVASLYMSLEMAGRIKKTYPMAKVIFGGPLFLNRKYISEVLQHVYVDAVIAGEGEDAIRAIAAHIASSGEFVNTPGIAFKSNGSVAVNPSGNPVNLDALPFLDLSDLPLADYDDAGHIVLMASRGCIRRCHFCSDAPCWPGYRAMSGERIYNEIAYHKKNNPSLGHVDFLDLEFNGRMESLISFCDLMSQNPMDIHWNANMVVRPELSVDVIRKLAQAGCEHVIFGIESGSERVLKLMNKHYNVADADRIIRQMHEAGICVTANFMFGFPGETETDFQETLGFLRRNAPYLDRAYPSRTYFAIEEFSYVYDHPDEFIIKPGYPNHLFWESVDGKNTYPVRMERCRKFCELALGLGVEVGKGVQTSVLQDEWFNLAHYYETTGDDVRAIEHLLKYYACDQRSIMVNDKITAYHRKLTHAPTGLDESLHSDLSLVADEIMLRGAISDNGAQEPTARLARETSQAFIKTKARNIMTLLESCVWTEENKRKASWEISVLAALMHTHGGNAIPEFHNDYVRLVTALSEKNTALNDREFEERKTVLVSSAQAIFLQFAGPCNSSCVFCSRGHEYRDFNLQEFTQKVEPKIIPQLLLARQFILTGSGEFLRLENWRPILEYFDYCYPHVEKMFSTNSSSLRPEVIDLITSQHSRYSIHASLHAADAATHRIMTRMDNFPQIIEQLQYLIQRRRQNNNVSIDLFFVATNLNIETLPDFVRLAKRLEVDSVIVNYNYIYVPAQKYLSCYFKPELTNRMFDEAARVASELGMRISLPPHFHEKKYPEAGICRELWSQIMFNDQGHVLPCDASHDCNLRLDAVNNFYDIWNSDYYVTMRRELIESRRTKCFNHCHRANPASVNLFASHVIHRGREGQEINELWEDNF